MKADLEALRAECAAIFPTGYGVERHHADAGQQNGDHKDRALAEVLRIRSTPGDVVYPASELASEDWKVIDHPHTRRVIGRYVHGLPGVHVRWRETLASKLTQWRDADSRIFEGWFYASAGQRGPGKSEHLASLEEDNFTPVYSEQYLYGMATGRDLAREVASAQKTAALNVGRRAGASANTKKAELLDAQIREVWLGLPVRLRGGAEVHRRLAGKPAATLRTVNRRLTAMGLRRP